MGVFGGIAASVVGGLVQGRAASKAADAQTDAANRQIDLQEKIYGEQKNLFKPFVKSGRRANKALMYELGLGELPTFGGGIPKIETIGGTVNALAGGYPTFPGGANPMTAGRDANKDPYNPGTATGGRAAPQQYSVKGQTFDTYEDARAYAESLRKPGFEYQGFQKTPGYDFQLSEGLNAIDRSAASSGGLFSGATLKAAQGYGQGLANQEYGNYLNRLTGMAGSGQSAAGMQGTAAQNYASGTSSALANIGNAQAAGSIGAGNAINSAISNGIGIWQYQNALNSGAKPLAVTTLAGGGIPGVY